MRRRAGERDVGSNSSSGGLARGRQDGRPVGSGSGPAKEGVLAEGGGEGALRVVPEAKEERRSASGPFGSHLRGRQA